MRSSYSEEDVILLLKEITGLVEPQPAKVREKLIQSGKHYSEMLPVEYVPTDQYMQVYHNALKHYAKPVANAVNVSLVKYFAQHMFGEEPKLPEAIWTNTASAVSRKIRGRIY